VPEVVKLFWKYGSPALAVDVHRKGRACNEGTHAFHCHVAKPLMATEIVLKGSE
jgi:hypothetical protein